MNQQIAVLYAREDSVYKGIPGCDVYDKTRDARTFTDRKPIIAHPPCRAWGRMRMFAKPRDDEKLLALHALELVRKNGGVLEHPEASSLWEHAALPRPHPERITYDRHGGWTLAISQSWFGHPAEKRTWLYIVGISAGEIPSFPLHLGYPQFIVASSPNIRKGQKGWLPKLSTDRREATPPAFANWLVELVSRIH